MGNLLRERTRPALHRGLETLADEHTAPAGVVETAGEFDSVADSIQAESPHY